MHVFVFVWCFVVSGNRFTLRTGFKGVGEIHTELFTVTELELSASRVRLRRLGVGGSRTARRASDGLRTVTDALCTSERCESQFLGRSPRPPPWALQNCPCGRKVLAFWGTKNTDFTGKTVRELQPATSPLLMSAFLLDPLLSLPAASCCRRCFSCCMPRARSIAVIIFARTTAKQLLDRA